MFRNVSRSFTTNAPWAMRPYTNQDAHRIKKIALPVIHDLVSTPPSLTDKQREEFYRNEVQRGLEVASTQVISKDDQVVGFITYHLSDKGFVKPTGVIEHLAIDPLYQKQRLGRALLKQAVKDLNEQGARTISLRITDPDVASFYEMKALKSRNILNLNGEMRASWLKFCDHRPFPS